MVECFMNFKRGLSIDLLARATRPLVNKRRKGSSDKIKFNKEMKPVSEKRLPKKLNQDGGKAEHSERDFSLVNTF